MSDPRRLGIYMLDVGQGDATVIVPPTGEGLPVVFDCRDDYVVHKVLEHWGYHQLDSVIVSHLDWDHIAGVRQLLERADLEIQHVYVNVDRSPTHIHTQWRPKRSSIALMPETANENGYSCLRRFRLTPSASERTGA